MFQTPTVIQTFPGVYSFHWYHYFQTYVPLELLDGSFLYGYSECALTSGLPGAQTSKRFWMEIGVLLGHQTNRPCAPFIIYGETEGKHTDSLATVWSQQSCKVAALRNARDEVNTVSVAIWARVRLRDLYLWGRSDFNWTWRTFGFSV